MYLTLSFPRVPATVAVNSGSASPYTLFPLFPVTVTLLGVIVNVPFFLFTITLSVTSTPSLVTIAVPVILVS